MTKDEAQKLVGRRHPEWREHATRWRWLLDSLEGGDRYRYAIYGTDRLSQFPIMNLVRHKRETESATDRRGLDLTTAYVAGVATSMAGTVNQGGGDVSDYARTTDNDFGMRLTRTPVPTFVHEAIETHLSRIYAREVKRTGPAALVVWWEDVDGCGTTIDEWMAETVAPLLLVLGQIDILMDHPPAPEGEPIVTQADVDRHGLARCVASYILPENMVWWRLNRDGSYAECLVREYGDDGPSDPLFRHWTKDGSALYDGDGVTIGVTPHEFGRVPIVRVFDRKKPRCRNVGQPRYEDVAEIQREFYNRDSELILSDTTQAHPLLQGPEDYIQSDGTIPIGPSWLLPKKKDMTGGSSTYEGFDVIEFPKEGAESIRRNKGDLRDEADRSAHLTKPAGVAGTTGGTVGQSGLSKRLDATAGNDVLSKIAGVLARAEATIARLAELILGSDGEFKVPYAREFELATAAEFAGEVAEFQSILDSSGGCPEVEEPMLCRLVRLSMPGQDDAAYAKYDAAIRAAVLAKKAQVAVLDQAIAQAAVTEAPNASDDEDGPFGEGDD